MIKDMMRHFVGKLARVVRATPLIFSFCLAACANGPPAKSLRTPAHADTITLNTAATYAAKGGLFGAMPWTVAVDPGVYTAVKEDDAGTYFRQQGKPVSLHMGNEKGTTWRHAGGIWVPRDPTKSPRVYHIADGVSTTNADDAGRSLGTATAGPEGGVVGGAAANAFQAMANRMDAGKISIAPEPPDAAFAAVVHAGFRSAVQ